MHISNLQDRWDIMIGGSLVAFVASVFRIPTSGTLYAVLTAAWLVTWGISLAVFAVHAFYEARDAQDRAADAGSGPLGDAHAAAARSTSHVWRAAIAVMVTTFAAVATIGVASPEHRGSGGVGSHSDCACGDSAQTGPSVP